MSSKNSDQREIRFLQFMDAYLAAYFVFVIFAFVVVRVYLLNREVEWIGGGYSSASLTCLFLCFAGIIFLTISRKVGKVLKKANPRILPEGVEIRSGDWTSVYFALAISIWVSRILFETAWVALIAIQNPDVNNLVVELNEFNDPYRIKDLSSILFSLLNSWFLLLTVRTIFLTPDKDYLRPYRKVWYIMTTDKAIKLLGGKFMTKFVREKSSFNFWLIALGVLISFSIMLWSLDSRISLGMFEYAIGSLPDTMFACFLGIVMANTLFITFLDREHRYLAMFVVPILLIAVVQTTMRGLFYAFTSQGFIDQVVNPALEQMRIGYKFILVPILIMLTVTYLVKLQESVRVKEAKNYEELRLARINVSHRIKNQLASIQSRIDFLTRQPKYSESKEAELLLDKFSGYIAGAIAVHESIEANTNPSSSNTNDIDLKYMLDDLIPSIWISAFGNEEDDLVFSNYIPPGVLMPRLKGGMVQEMINELLCNINEHAYKGKNESRRLWASASVVDENLIVAFKDHGNGFDENDIAAARKSFGLRSIFRAIQEMDGSISFLQAEPENELSPGTVCNLSIPINKPLI